MTPSRSEGKQEPCAYGNIHHDFCPCRKALESKLKAAEMDRNAYRDVAIENYAAHCGCNGVKEAHEIYVDAEATRLVAERRGEVNEKEALEIFNKHVPIKLTAFEVERVAVPAKAEGYLEALRGPEVKAKDAEVAELKKRIELATHWEPVQGGPCVLCKYEEGRLVFMCGHCTYDHALLHESLYGDHLKELQAERARNQQLEFKNHEMERLLSVKTAEGDAVEIIKAVEARNQEQQRVMKLMGEALEKLQVFCEMHLGKCQDYSYTALEFFHAHQKATGEEK